MSQTQGAPEPGLNERILFWASFLTLVAAGIGFSVRGATTLANWSKEFGFTQSELGKITGGGLVGFGITIIAFSFIADKIGYKALMIIAFVLHLLSAIVTVMATPIFNALGRDSAFYCLWTGMLLFSLGNGTCEAVINPLTATLYPRNKTHWLNILHAGWPAGLIIGAILGLCFEAVAVRWEVQMSVFLIPVLAYGIMMIGRPFPVSEASASGVPLGQMLGTLASPILICLFLLHAMVGYVELGTDSWMSNITSTILKNPYYGIVLFIWTSGLMTALRFFAGPIVEKISPLGLLCVSAVLGSIGLVMLGTADGLFMCVLAATVYALGKTFLWPTMLGVVSERYPKGGALALGFSGGIGMLSAGLLGGPLIGYKQDVVASKVLMSKSSETYERYKAPEPSSPLPGLPAVNGLDGSKVATLLEEEPGKSLAADLAALEKSGRTLSDSPELAKKADWWTSQGKPNIDLDKNPVSEARIQGSRWALIYTAAVPATMAVGYLLLIVFFMFQGGYKQVHLENKS